MVEKSQKLEKPAQ